MSETNYKVGIYLRLSREDERLGESGSISTQRDLLLNYIRDNNLIFVDEYVDDGVSGTTFDRVGFNRMIKDCEEKKINMIITKDTSRLGRDHIEFGFYVERYFPEHNIRYVAVNDGIDTFKNSSANDMLVFKSAFNDMYVKDIYSINYKKLKKLNIKYLFFDLDNTIISYKESIPNEKTIKLFESLKDMGFICIIISNSYSKRLQKVKEYLNIDVYYNSMKPLKKTYKKILKQYNKENIAFIGDQIMTDVFGAKRNDLFVIFLDKIDKYEPIRTKILRFFEKIILKKYSKKNILIKGKYYE